MYQYEAVEQVLRENGGYATLKTLYQRAPHVEGSEWGTKTPNASIRRIVQTREEFFKIRPGLWALVDCRDELPESVYRAAGTAEQRAQYDHWYFQGLLTEIGNARRAETWVPVQDKNRPFLDRTLGDVSSLESLPAFGYEELVQRASTVDTVWFNERRMPATLVEVEFSTDFQNSLHKFVDLRDYHASFVVAADETRKAQFEKRLSQSGFAPIRDRVEFLSFDEVSQLHAAAEATTGLDERLRAGV
ncbi:winged helix-turn-helix domain-containing protein [Haloarcula nitratireducens]|uniref:Winged helix-turn-helix domain-containing protein n=1 Tax=Haloarcula nitratireducens TaxID=2487749 RepID=A0AAW4PEG5_9EURY|nr:winged helix-turn-helix domain-containing protein [Halomicroarcula nitratireducens]MBX0295647.1 winged helix-turn-helix domain-containing protein [Halomicroarcula nitratireducens]